MLVLSSGVRAPRPSHADHLGSSSIRCSSVTSWTISIRSGKSWSVFCLIGSFSFLGLFWCDSGSFFPPASVQIKTPEISVTQDQIVCDRFVWFHDNASLIFFNVCQGCYWFIQGRGAGESSVVFWWGRTIVVWCSLFSWLSSREISRSLVSFIGVFTKTTHSRTAHHPPLTSLLVTFSRRQILLSEALRSIK